MIDRADASSSRGSLRIPARWSVKYPIAPAIPLSTQSRYRCGVVRKRFGTRYPRQLKSALPGQPPDSISRHETIMA